MGDLIIKLPTDNVVMPPEERENFLMLFPEEPYKNENNVPVPTQEQPVERKKEKMNHKLKKEVLCLTLFVGVFFVLNLPYIKKLITEYIPLCNKSWIATNLVQSIVFAFVLWIFINSEYSRA